MSIKKSSSVADAFLRAHPDIRHLDVLLADLGATPRGKRLHIDDLATVYAGGFLLPGSMFALDTLGNTVESTGLGFDEGDADRQCLPLDNSLVPVPWSTEGVAQIQVSMFEHDRTPFFGDPRHVLGDVLKRFASRGLKPVVAIELEFYVVDINRLENGNVQPAALPGSGRRPRGKQINSMSVLGEMSAILTEIVRAAELQHVPATTVLAECGPGQYEVNLRHETDAQQACDSAVRLKRLVRGIFLRHGMQATFMAKPYADASGNGGHIHVSLLNEQGHNVFASSAPEGNDMLRQAIGGLATTMADCMLVFAPTANSYRRLQPMNYVPLDATWGVNNRGVALRIPVSDATNRRIEHRVSGADVNPYLLTAAVLAGIHYGLEKRSDPGPPLMGNPYATGAAPTLPTYWPAAAQAFARSDFIRDYFGERFQRLYHTVRQSELQAFDAHVTPLEYDWYLNAG